MEYRCLLKLPVRPLDQDETKMYITLAMLQMDAPQAQLQKLHEEMWRGLAYKIICDRLGKLLPLVSIPLRAWVACICKTPGEAVMWAFTLMVMIKEWEARRDRVPENGLNISVWSFAFPMGIPTEESYRMAWEAQKGYAMDSTFDNWLDDPANWPGTV